MAIAGAAGAAVFVYTVGSLGRGGATPLKLALAGAATRGRVQFLGQRHSAAADRRDERVPLLADRRGRRRHFGSISLVLPFLVVGAVICFVSARGLNSLALGEEVAAGLGERVATTRLVAAAGAVLLCGAATAVAGPIGFVGLVVPHVCRLLVGIDHRWLLPFSMLVGAILLTGADVIGRVVARPAEVDVGIITALVGAPFFIYIVRRQKVRSL